MNKLLCLLSMVLLTLNAQAQAVRVYKSNGQVIIADSAGTVPVPYKPKAVVVDASGSQIRIIKSGEVRFYAPTKFFNQSGVAWSPVSASAAVAAYQNSSTTSSGSSGTNVAGVSSVNGQTGAVTITVPTSPSQVGAAPLSVTSAVASLSATVNAPMATALKQFFTKVVGSANSAVVPVRVIGTSIAYSDITLPGYVGRAIATQFGLSRNQYVTPVNFPANGWKQQYYSGPFSIRFRGLASEGATTNFFGLAGIGVTSVTLYYDKELDGGQMNISVQAGSGTAVVQTPVSCSGSTSYHNAVTYSTDPTQTATIQVTPVGTGASYLSGILFSYGDQGVMYSNTAYGGSSLANHAGTTQRSASTGMAPTATPSGRAGLKATFAPQDPAIKPAVTIFSGWTNDGSDANFPANLDSAARYCIGNGGSLIMVVEPINAQANVATWLTQRQAMYTVAAKYPDNILVYDFDQFLSPTGQPGVFAPRFHSADPNDPHPQNIGNGDPHVPAAVDLLRKLNLPFPSTLDRMKALASYDARTAVSSVSPRFTGSVGIGSGTINTSKALHVTSGDILLGTQFAGDANVTQYGSYNLIAGGGGFGSFNVYSNSTSAASAFELGNTGTNGKRYQFVVGGNNNGGGNGTAPSEGSLIIKRQPDDAAVVFITKGGNLGLNTYPPNPAAILQADATDRGFLPPRMTTGQRNAIASPPEGLEIYNLTTHAKEYWNGSVWKTVTTN